VPGKSANRTSDVLGLHFSGNRVNQELGQRAGRGTLLSTNLVWKPEHRSPSRTLFTTLLYNRTAVILVEDSPAKRLSLDSLKSNPGPFGSLSCSSNNAPSLSTIATLMDVERPLPAIIMKLEVSNPSDKLTVFGHSDSVKFASSAVDNMPCPTLALCIGNKNKRIAGRSFCGMLTHNP
jgi:hypothetical protein